MDEGVAGGGRAAVIVSYDCPNCGGNIRAAEGGEVTCRYCGSQFAIPVAASRKELELEREQLLAHADEIETRIRHAKERNPQELLIPPLGCCGLYVVVFVLGSFVLTAMGMQDSRTAIAAAAIVAGLIGAVLIVLRNERRRRERLLALDRERSAERELRERRLREIEAELNP